MAGRADRGGAAVSSSSTKGPAQTQAERWRQANGLTDPLPVTRATTGVERSRAALAAKKEAAKAAAHHRATDPAEQARRILQQRGRTVYRASVVGGAAHLWVCTGLAGHVDDAALIAAADKVSGGGDRIAAARREDAMTVVNHHEAAILARRGLTKARVLVDLARVIAAAGTVTGAARRLGFASASSLSNWQSGHSPISSGLLGALYGETGARLRRELLTDGALPVAVTAAVATVPAAAWPPRDASEEAEPEQPDPECHDVGDALAARAAEPPVDPDTTPPSAAAVVTAVPLADAIAHVAAVGVDDRAAHPDGVEVPAAIGGDSYAAAITTLDVVRQRIAADATAAKAAIDAECARKCAALDVAALALAEAA